MIRWMPSTDGYDSFNYWDYIRWLSDHLMGKLNNSAVVCNVLTMNNSYNERALNMASSKKQVNSEQSSHVFKGYVNVSLQDPAATLAAYLERTEDPEFQKSLLDFVQSAMEVDVRISFKVVENGCQVSAMNKDGYILSAFAKNAEFALFVLSEKLRMLGGNWQYKTDAPKSGIELFG